LRRSFGLKDLEEYQQVASNIALVIFGIDAKTKAYTDPPTMAKKLLDEVKVDKALTGEERTQVAEDLTNQLKVVQPIMHPSNIDLVKKRYDRIEPLLT
jgi:hypothetical protein